jgi:hypothetical protein
MSPVRGGLESRLKRVYMRRPDFLQTRENAGGNQATREVARVSNGWLIEKR